MDKQTEEILKEIEGIKKDLETGEETIIGKNWVTCRDRLEYMGKGIMVLDSSRYKILIKIYTGTTLIIKEEDLDDLYKVLKAREMSKK